MQVDGTKKQLSRPQSEWLRLDAPDLRIVSEIFWEHIAERHHRNEAAYLQGAHGRLLARPTGEDQCSVYLLSSLAKCVICGGFIVACKNVTKRWYACAVYRCAYNHKRGKSICSNDVQLHQDVLDSAILHAVHDAIDERVLEASVVSALNRIRAE